VIPVLVRSYMQGAVVVVTVGIMLLSMLLVVFLGIIYRSADVMITI